MVASRDGRLRRAPRPEPSPEPGSRPAPRRHHHGRQRALGEAALPAARGGPSPRRGGRARGREGLHRARRRVPHALRVLERELAPPARGGVVPDAALPALARAGGREARTPTASASRSWATCRRSTRASASTSRAARRSPRDNTRLTLTIAANYGGRWDILQAANRCRLEDPAAPITEERIARFLSMSYAPEPDLFIRTGGEKRVSNFLLWQLAYTELYFTDALWPDFDAAALDEAIASYRRASGASAARASSSPRANPSETGRLGAAMLPPVSSPRSWCSWSSSGCCSWPRPPCGRCSCSPWRWCAAGSGRGCAAFAPAAG